MPAEVASPEPAQRVGAVLPAGDRTRAVTAGRATTVTVFGVLAAGTSAFDSIARNLAGERHAVDAELGELAV